MDFKDLKGKTTIKSSKATRRSITAIRIIKATRKNITAIRWSRKAIQRVKKQYEVENNEKCRRRQSYKEKLKTSN